MTEETPKPSPVPGSGENNAAGGVVIDLTGSKPSISMPDASPHEEPRTPEDLINLFMEMGHKPKSEKDNFVESLNGVQLLVIITELSGQIDQAQDHEIAIKLIYRAKSLSDQCKELMASERMPKPIDLFEQLKGYYGGEDSKEKLEVANRHLRGVATEFAVESFLSAVSDSLGSNNAHESGAFSFRPASADQDIRKGIDFIVGDVLDGDDNPTRSYFDIKCNFDSRPGSLINLTPLHNGKEARSVDVGDAQSSEGDRVFYLVISTMVAISNEYKLMDRGRLVLLDQLFENKTISIRTITSALRIVVGDAYAAEEVLDELYKLNDLAGV